MIPATITRTGIIVDCIPTAKPVIKLVPAPVTDASAIDLTGLYFVLV